MTISEQIRKEIARRGLSQLELAKASGISQGRLSEFINGGQLRSDNIDRIASTLRLRLTRSK